MNKPLIMLTSREKSRAISWLLKDRFAVTEVTKEDVLKSIPVMLPSIVIIDSSISAEHDINLCKSIREMTDIPIIIVSREPGVEDIINGLNAGADDYISKPFNNKELAARIRAVLRRSILINDIIKLPLAEFNKGRKTITVDGKVTCLTKKEIELLWLLTSKPGKVFPREELLKTIWDYKYFDDTRVVDAYVKKTRKKMQVYGSQPWVIRTVFTVGFKLEIFTDEDQNDSGIKGATSCVC